MTQARQQRWGSRLKCDVYLVPFENLEQVVPKREGFVMDVSYGGAKLALSGLTPEQLTTLSSGEVVVRLHVIETEVPVSVVGKVRWLDGHGTTQVLGLRFDTDTKHLGPVIEQLRSKQQVEDRPRWALAAAAAVVLVVGAAAWLATRSTSGVSSTGASMAAASAAQSAGTATHHETAIGSSKPGSAPLNNGFGTVSAEELAKLPYLVTMEHGDRQVSAKLQLGPNQKARSVRVRPVAPNIYDIPGCKGSIVHLQPGVTHSFDCAANDPLPSDLSLTIEELP